MRGSLAAVNQDARVASSSADADAARGAAAGGGAPTQGGAALAGRDCAAARRQRGRRQPLEGAAHGRRRNRARTARPYRAPAAPGGRRLAAAWQRLGTLLTRGAVAAGFETEQWTLRLRRVAALIRREFDARYHFRFRSLGRALHAHGFSPQHPGPRAAERDEAVVRAWLHHDWPALNKELAASGTRLPSWTRRVTRFGPA
jgi:transposase